MKETELTAQKLAELYQPRAVELIKSNGREPAGIDSLRHHNDYMTAIGNEADLDDLKILSQLFNLATQELVAEMCPRPHMPTVAHR